MPTMSTKLLKPKVKSTRKPGADGAARIRDIVINGDTHIPTWVVDHETFRRWACSDDFPSRGQFFYLDGKFWVDLSMETLIHNQIKGIISAVIMSFVCSESLGRFLVDRMMLTNTVAHLSCEPDGMFIANESLERGSVTFVKGDESLEVIGTPDMTLEVISKTTVPKDTVDLMEKYANAGIPEYWLVDSTVDVPELVILRLVNGKYVAARKHDGWVKSKVFGRSFRLTCKKDVTGLSQFNLETK
jgi:Uma2 family endonuclease